MARREREDVKPDDGITSKLVAVNRVSKTVKGGRNMRFSALVVVGDGKGSVGLGAGKAAEVPEAIKKAEQLARRSMVKISLAGDTIPHEAEGVFGKASVLLKPAPEGTGVIAGGAVRAVLEMAGIKNIRTKCLRSTNVTNVVKATFEGLKALRTAEEVAQLRGLTVEELRN